MDDDSRKTLLALAADAAKFAGDVGASKSSKKRKRTNEDGAKSHGAQKGGAVEKSKSNGVKSHSGGQPARAAGDRGDAKKAPAKQSDPAARPDGKPSRERGGRKQREMANGAPKNANGVAKGVAKSLSQPHPPAKAAQQPPRAEGKGTKTYFDGERGASSKAPAKQGKAAKASSDDTLLISPEEGAWHQIALDPVPVAADFKHEDAETVRRRFAEAESLMHRDTETYEALARSGGNRSDAQWLATVMQSGTMSDKLAACTVRVQESPAHRLNVLRTLLGMAQKKNRREALLAIDALRELFVDTLLPDRRLKPFAERPVAHKGVTNKHLAVWYVEEMIRRAYAEFVGAVEAAAKDPLADPRNKAIKTLHQLLSRKPEQERRLLEALVNKLGDQDAKIASKVGYLLSLLVQEHPNMKAVVAGEVERLASRAHISPRAQYYGVCFLNQIILTKKDAALASKLIAFYLAVFKATVGKGDMDARMLGALLTGVNRAFPFSSPEDETMDAHADTLFRVVHVSPFGTSVQALTLLFQFLATRQTLSDRFYRALYAKMLDPELRSSSKQAMFLNVLYRAMKADSSQKRAMAFARRLVQVAATCAPQFVCAALVLLSEVIEERPGLRALMLQAEDEDDDEKFVDVLDEEDAAAQAAATRAASESEEPVAMETDGKDASDGSVGKSDPHEPTLAHSKDAYDPLKREPLHAHADRSCAWELSELQRHYHPTVSVYATTLLEGKRIAMQGDPLNDQTLARFLDRFVYKNPKKRLEKDRGGSLMQPKARASKTPTVLTPDQYEAMKEDEVQAEDLFFHKYFTAKAVQQRRMEAKKKKKKDRLEDGDGGDAPDDDIGDDEFFDAIAGGEGGEGASDEEMEDMEDMEGAGDVDDADDASDAGSGEDGGEDESDGEDGADGGFSYDDLEELSEDELDDDAPTAKRQKGDNADLKKALHRIATEESDDEESGSDDGFVKGLGADESDEDDDGSEGGDADAMEDDDSDDGAGGKATQRGKGKRSSYAARTGSVFASADDFAEMLESSGRTSEADAKQLAWEERKSYGGARGGARRGGRGRGGRGSRGGRGGSNPVRGVSKTKHGAGKPHRGGKGSQGPRGGRRGKR